MASASWSRRAVLGIALAGALVAWLYPTDEKRVKAAAEAIVAGANEGPRALSLALEEHALPSVRLSVSELAEPLEGKSALVEALAAAEAVGVKPHYRVESVDVRVEGNRARLSADLLTQAQAEVPELRRPRRGTALFEKRGGKFRLASADIGAERLDQPEARP
jgi:DNA-binding transcriptional ArsR family regulator